MGKLNCWEFKKCGFEPGGEKAKKFKACPAALEMRLHGSNSGHCAGRSCWVVSGTLFDGQVQGNFATKMGNCIKCDFFNLVVREESDKLVKMTELINKLKE